ncbi:MAG: hypothetical protein ACSLE6_00795 [Mycobacterium sp.]
MAAREVPIPRCKVLLGATRSGAIGGAAMILDRVFSAGATDAAL